MEQTEFYERLLGLEKPWDVSEVKLDVGGGQVEVFLEHDDGHSWCCPGCGDLAPVYDHAAQRTWRHLDTCQLRTLLKARLPRVECPACGVRQVEAPWAEPGGRFTLMMEAFIIAALKQCETVKGAAALARVSWSAAMGVMDRAVVRGLERRGGMAAKKIGVDEKAFRKGHNYDTLVYDLDASAVLYVGEKRTKESLCAYYRALSEEELAGIEAVAMDMWPAYYAATIAHVPGAVDKIVFDRFHVASHMGDAVDKVRRAESAELAAIGAGFLLKGTRYDWLRSEENVPDSRRENFSFLQGVNLKTSRAWAIKETLRGLWSYRSKGAARRFFKKWYAWAIRSQLEPVKRVARMVKRHIENIITYCKHPITNAVAEGINSKIMSIKRQSSGFRNRGNFKTAVYFYCGNLNTDPLESA
jgi:transposase